MKSNHKKTFFGSLVALCIGTSCCWLSTLAVWFGGAAFLTLLSRFIEQYNYAFLVIAAILFLVGLRSLWRYKNGR